MKKHIDKIFVCMCTLVLMLMPGFIFSQGNDFQPVTDMAGFKINFKKGASGIQSIQCDFKQRKNLAVLEEELKSTGKFYFKRENKVRIEYEQPFYYLMIVNGSQVLVKDEAKENKMNMGSSRLFKQINAIIVDAVQGTILDNDDFLATVLENDKSYLVKLKPVSKALGELFSTILIYLDQRDFSVNQLEMIEPSGDFTVMTYANKQLNIPLADEKFAIR